MYLIWADYGVRCLMNLTLINYQLKMNKIKIRPFLGDTICTKLSFSWKSFCGAKLAISLRRRFDNICMFPNYVGFPRKRKKIGLLKIGFPPLLIHSPMLVLFLLLLYLVSWWPYREWKWGRDFFQLAFGSDVLVLHWFIEESVWLNVESLVLTLDQISNGVYELCFI